MANRADEEKSGLSGSSINDDGYVSDYLIHWTGKKSDDDGARVLSIVAKTLRLLLSYNRIHGFDLCYEIHEKMVCFTDVPIRHSSEHCKRYGRFGIAFHKLKLMNVGAQPVFYASHACKRDMNAIFRFLQEQVRQTTLPRGLFRALLRHFYLVQKLSNGHADGRDTFYYEREWRLGEQTLVPEEKLKRPNAKFRAEQEGYPPSYTGRLVEKDDETFFAFDKEDVAFLIAPRAWQAKIKNTHAFRLETYEDLVGPKNEAR